MDEGYFLSEKEEQIYKRTMLKKENYSNKNTFVSIGKELGLSKQRVHKIFTDIEKRIKRINYLKQKQNEK